MLGVKFQKGSAGLNKIAELNKFPNGEALLKFLNAENKVLMEESYFPTTQKEEFEATEKVCIPCVFFVNNRIYVEMCTGYQVSDGVYLDETELTIHS